VFLLRLQNFLEVIAFLATLLKTLRTIPVGQLTRVDGQMAVLAAYSRALLGEQ
jgi:hypothetical protein